MNKLNKIIVTTVFLLVHSLALAFELPPLDTLDQKLSFLLQIKEIIPNLFSDSANYDFDLFTLLENEQELLTLLKKHPQFEELFKRKLYYKLEVTPPKEGVLMEDISIKAEAVEQWKQELLSNWELFSQEYSTPDIFLKFLEDSAKAVDVNVDALSIINTIGRFNKDKSYKSNIKIFKHINDIVQQCKKEDNIISKFKCIKNNYSKISIPINQVRLPGLPLEEEIELIIKNLIDREKLQKMLLLGATIYSAPNQEWASSNWQEVKNYLERLTGAKLIFLNDKNEVLLPLISKLINTSQEDKKTRFLLEAIYKKFHFYASQTDKKQKLITKGIILEQVPPEIGIFRGSVGGDCSSHYSFPYPNYPDEMVFFIYDQNQKNKALKGYLSATLVEIENGEKALYVITIAGKKLSSSDTKIIFMGLEQAKNQLGAQHIVLPVKEKIGNLINYPAIKDIYLELVEKSKKIKINYFHPAIRSIIENYKPYSSYNIGFYDHSVNNQNAEIITYSINPIKINVEILSFKQIEKKDLSNFKFSKIFEFLKDLRKSSMKNFKSVVDILENDNFVEKNVIYNLFDIIDNKITNKIGVEEYKLIIIDEFIKLDIDRSFLYEHSELLFPGIFNCSDWSSEENIIEVTKLAIKIINNDYEDKQQYFNDDIIVSLRNVDIFNEFSVKYINNLSKLDKRKKALSVLEKFFSDLPKVHSAIAKLLNDADSVVIALRIIAKAPSISSDTFLALANLVCDVKYILYVSPLLKKHYDKHIETVISILNSPFSIAHKRLLDLIYFMNDIDKKILVALSQLLENSDADIRSKVLNILIHNNGFYHDNIDKIILCLNDPIAEIRLMALALIVKADIHVKLEGIISQTINQFLVDKNKNIVKKTLNEIKFMKNKEKETLFLIIDLLKDSDPIISDLAEEVLRESPTDNQEVINALIKLLDEPLMQKKALNILGKNIIINPEHHLIISRFFTHEDNYIFAAALYIIENNKTENEKIINDIAELLKHEDTFRRRWAVQALGNLKPSDPEIHLSMARLLLSSRQIITVVLEALVKVNIQHPKVHKFIRKLSQDKVIGIREAALSAMASLGIPN